jgi:hypothetical protein
VSAQTPVYLYNQRQYVVLLELSSSATIRYETVYSKELKLNRGVDNVLEFAFINQEQKPVNISGKQITARILNYEGNEILIQKSCTPILPVTGITSLVITAEELESIPYQQCYYSLEIPVNEFNYPVFVDSSGGARGVIRIVDSVLPSFVHSENVTIPTHSSPETGVSRTYYSSVFKTDEDSILTIQTSYNNFTGTTQLQGSTLADFAYFYDIDSVVSYTAHTGEIGTTINGYHPYVRMKIVNDGTPPPSSTGKLSGDVTRILIR